MTRTIPKHHKNQHPAVNGWAWVGGGGTTSPFSLGSVYSAKPWGKLELGRFVPPWHSSLCSPLAYVEECKRPNRLVFQTTNRKPVAFIANAPASVLFVGVHVTVVGTVNSIVLGGTPPGAVVAAIVESAI